MGSTEEFKGTLSNSIEEHHSDGESSDPLLVRREDASSPTLTTPLMMDSSNTTSNTKNNSNTRSTYIRRWLQNYVRFTGSAGNQDKVLKLFQWSLWLAGAGLLNHHRKRNNANNIMIKHSAEWLQKLSFDVSFARYVTRLLGIPVALEAAMNDSWTVTSLTNSKSNNTLHKLIGKILAYSMLLYYPTEHCAYALWMRPANHPDNKIQHKVWYKNPSTWSYVSCRFWLAYIVAEITQCMLQLNDLSTLKQKQLIHKRTDDDDNHQQQEENNNNKDNNNSNSLESIEKKISNTQLQVLRNIFFLFPCINWSLKEWDTKPWLKPITVNTLMWAEAITSFYQAIKNFQ